MDEAMVMSDDPDGHRLARDMIEVHGAIAAANPAGIEAGIRTRTFPANSTSIAGTAEHAAPSRRV
jgi:hypothetical protein